MTCPRCGATGRAEAKFCAGCGNQFDTGPSTGLVPVDKPAAAEVTPTVGWWNRRRVIIASVVVLAVIAGLGVYLMRQSTGDRTPDGPVREYFTALAAGDGPVAAALLEEANMGGADVLSSPMWADGALADGYTAPHHVALDVSYGQANGIDQRPNMDYATVTARYVVDETEVVQQIGMTRGEGMVERPWSIRSIDLGLLSTGDEDTGMDIAGTHQAGQFWAPPGTYEVSMSGSVLLEDASGQVTVTPTVGDGMADVAQLDLTVRPEVVETVDEQIRGRIDECADAGPPLDLETCPWLIGATYTNRAISVRWNVESYPVVTLDVSDGDVMVTVVEPGIATAKYKRMDDQVETIAADLYPAGIVTADHSGQVSWTYNAS